MSGTTEYLIYCSNTRCANHRGQHHWSQTRPQNVPPRCPLCGEPLVIVESGPTQEITVVDMEEIQVTGSPHGESDESSDDSSSGGETVGVVLTTAPYGNYTLMYGDDDSDHRWGGEVREETARHIAELKQDLLLLGYYSPPRFRTIERDQGDTFHIHLVGAVLAFKYDLVHTYGVSATPPPEQPLAHGDGTPDEHDRLTVQTAGDIFYDQEISNPYFPHLAPVMLQVVGQRFRTPPFENQLRRATRDWNNWKTRAERGRDRHRGDDPYVQPAVRPLLTNRLRRERRRGDPTGLVPAIESLCDDLPAASGEPDPGSAVQSGLEPVQRIEEKLSSLLSDVHTARLEVDAWDESGASGLRSEVSRLEGVAAGEGREARAATRTLRAYRARLESWEAYRDLWRQLDQRVSLLAARLRGAVRQHHDELRAYREALIRNSWIDRATAVHIKHMLLQRSLPKRGGTRGVFVVPTNDEIEELPEGTDMSDMITTLCERRDVPNPIAQEAIHHESGHQSHGYGRGRRRIQVVIYGVDYNNLGNRHAFDEALTRVDPWKWSIGWGATQYTTFSARAQGFDHAGGIPITDGEDPPIPDYIRSAEGNVDTGVSLIRRKFEHTAELDTPRDCTFERRFDCAACLSPARFGCADVDELLDLFKAVNRSGNPTRRNNQWSYYLDLPPERLQELFGVDPASVQTPQQKIELPCSWLTAKMHYGGSGPQAWAGMRRCIASIARQSGGAASDDD